MLTDQQILHRISKSNVTYHMLGVSDRSAMPIGNGVLGASVWVEQDGNICFYLSRSDAITELDRTVKLGMYRISFQHPCFIEGSYTQTLSLTEGCIHFTGKNCTAKLWIDCEEDALYLEGTFFDSNHAFANYINWRTAPWVHGTPYPKEDPVCESADICKCTQDEALFYHHNTDSMVFSAAKLQELDDCLDVIPDLVKGRTFGGYSRITHHNGSFLLKVLTGSQQIPPDQFTAQLKNRFSALSEGSESFYRTCNHWNRYWTKSYIFVDGDTPASNNILPEILPFCNEPQEFTCEETSAVTRAYTLTKYMTACCSGGPFPILYNGMLFNLCPGGQSHLRTTNFGETYTSQPGPFTSEFNPDERSWCREHLWQNIRHPYFSLLQRGEGESLKHLFAYYRRFWDLNRKRAQKYDHAEGQYNTEMTLSCGLQTPGIYGIDRTGMPTGYSFNRWGGAVDISPGLELASLMLDYADFYNDSSVRSDALTYAKDLFHYVETRFPETKNGIMQIGPLNSVETYRDTLNPTPVVAGLRYLASRIFDDENADIEIRHFFGNYLKKLPHLCTETENGQTCLLPAEKFDAERFNVEIPELYAIHPFPLFHARKPDVQTAINTYLLRSSQYGIRKCFRIGQRPTEGSYSGWQYLGVVAAKLGMLDEAETILTNNCALQNPGTRFPAMWGPIYDAVPDTDHGANILGQLQAMVLHADKNTVQELPCFPPHWHVAYKLYSNAHTVITGSR